MLNMVSYADDWIDGYLKEGHGTATIAADWRNHLGPPRSPNRIRMFDRAKSGSIPKGFEDIWNIRENLFPGTIEPLGTLMFIQSENASSLIPFCSGKLFQSNCQKGQP